MVRTLVAFASFGLAGCAYGLRVELPAEAGTPFPPESEIARTVDQIQTVADAFGLLRVRHEQHLDYLENTANDPSYSSRVLAWFVGGDPESESSGVFLSIGIYKATGSVDIVIRDHDHVGETPYLRALQKAVERTLAQAFPKRRIEADRLYDFPLYTRP